MTKFQTTRMIFCLPLPKTLSKSLLRTCSRIRLSWILVIMSSSRGLPRRSMKRTVWSESSRGRSMTSHVSAWPGYKTHPRAKEAQQVPSMLKLSSLAPRNNWGTRKRRFSGSRPSRIRTRAKLPSTPKIMSSLRRKSSNSKVRSRRRIRKHKRWRTISRWSLIKMSNSTKSFPKIRRR